jgi:GT2 family glycosyltransferase
VTQLGIVTIGRNEGERLRQCLNSVVGRGVPVIYVDSGSTDGSLELARSLGVAVVELDMSQPFTMARARNAGFAHLEEIAPDVRYVQFVDGDCEVVAGWLDRALAQIEARPDVAIVGGRRRERFPDRSIYNRIADIEWISPLGEVKYCGGDAMIRVEAFRQVHGYQTNLIAGEDPDLAIRIRQAGWRILCLDAEMTVHDMAMTRFGQWWKRCVRTGFAFAEGAAMHGKPPERLWVRHVRSALSWGIALPLLIVALAWPTRGLGLVLAMAYPVQEFRVGRNNLKSGLSPQHAWIYGGRCVLGRFPHGVGAVRDWSSPLLGRRQHLIEYKGAGQ